MIVCWSVKGGSGTTVVASTLALVLLGAAVIALLVIAWATDGGGAGRIGELFDTVLSGIFDRTDALEQ
jgi:hypothetical protein